jgi:hypothetical protein
MKTSNVGRFKISENIKKAGARPKTLLHSWPQSKLIRQSKSPRIDTHQYPNVNVAAAIVNMTLQASAFPRRRPRPGFDRSPKNRGRGECRALNAPAASYAK